MRRNCHCGEEYAVLKSEVEKGQGLSCSKACEGNRKSLDLPGAKKRVKLSYQYNRIKRISRHQLGLDETAALMYSFGYQSELN